MSQPAGVDDFSFRVAANLGASLAEMARSIGGRERRWDDAWAVDANSPHPLPNSVALLKPLAEPAAADLAVRIKEFFAAGSGGPSLIWSFWDVDESASEAFTSQGFTAIPGAPVMYRLAGAPAIDYPAGLDIVEAHDDATVRDFEATFIKAYPVPEYEPYEPGRIITVDGLGGPLRLWVGYVDGRPVTTAIAYIGFGVVGVYWIATLPEARGRGYGTAMTDVAARVQPELPAVLQSSDLGRPVYERMGFASTGPCRMWFMAQLGAAAQAAGD